MALPFLRGLMGGRAAAGRLRQLGCLGVGVSHNQWVSSNLGERMFDQGLLHFVTNSSSQQLH